jgi:hypothetical protein
MQIFNKTNLLEPEEITSEQIDKFMAIHGPKGVRTLSIAGKSRPVKEALSSDIGRTLLHDVMIKMEMLLEKIIQVKASKEELAEYRNLRDILNRWAGKIAIYEQAKKKIKGE